MGKLILVHEPPKGRHWKVEVDGRNVEDEAELFDLVRGIVRAKSYYYRTNFGGKNFSYARSRQRHFRDGYWVYTFWFTRMAEAALFKLMAY
jgi:hypothetical protein